MAGTDLWAGFMIFHDDYERLKFLDSGKKLAVLDALNEYSQTGVVVDMGDQMMNIVYDIMVKAIDRARAKSINAKKGHANKRKDAYESNDLHTSANFCNDLHTSAHICTHTPDDATDRSNLLLQSKCKPNTKDEADTDTNADEESDCQSQTAVIRYCTNAGMSLSGKHMDEIFDFLNDGIGADMQMHAVDLTIENGKKAWGYTKSILTRWRDEGIRTLEAAMNDHAAFKAKKNPEPVSKLPPEFKGKKYNDAF